ncbi:hypothetical protein Ahy_B05g079570 [Arachis hypogaea]|uniref:Ubiquitin-like protease family profile domain-containing protein n=1 Tax=Arachis hypogaea TaxID=3818 RepID=A0A444ZA87_ARAHY|nr:hypothetical protein Ahy_B05g079570 [Arachis hypogaea]
MTWTHTLRVDTGDIRITAELIGKVFGIPSRGDPIPELQKKDKSHLAIKRQFQKKTTIQLRDFLFACPMETEQQRMTFRRYFIIVVLKMFLNPTSQQTISPWHLPPILDVSNPRRFHWPYHILNWLRAAIRKFQDENRETCGGCMFVLLVLYFHRLKHGPLHACRVPEPWIVEWITNELDQKANYVISQESKTGTRRKVHVHKSHSRRCTKKAIGRENLARSNPAPLVVPDSDDDDDVPLARRIQLFQRQPPPHDVKQADPVFKGNHNSPQEANTDKKKGSPRTPPAALVQLSDYDFDREFDISIVQYPEFEQVLNSVEQGRETNAIIMQPLQTVLPNKSSYHTPSPGRPSFSLGLTQFEKTPTPSPLHSIHPTLKNIKLGETKEEQIRTWIVSSSLDENQELAKYEGREYMVLQRKDFWTLKPHSWVNSCEFVTRDNNVASFIDGVTPIYAGLSPSFGEDNRFFDKTVAAKRNWWLFPYCWRGHWWVYAFEVNAKRIVILDSLHSAPEDDKRDKLDAYVGRLCEDMASIAILGFVRTPYGPARSYASFDCGMCVIKFTESWKEDRELYEWDEDSLSSYRMELMLDIICGPHNAMVHQLVSLLSETVKPVRRNAPRNKKKDVSSPYTAPSTRSLIERAEGLPNGAMRKGRKKLLT